METINIQGKEIAVQYVPIDSLKRPEQNYRKWTESVKEQVKESLRRYGCVDPLIANSASGRENVVIGGALRLEMAKELGISTLPVVYLNIPDAEKERELTLRLNKNVAEFDLDALAELDEAFLKDIGFESEDLDKIFEEEPTPEMWNLEEELQKLDINNIHAQKGDVYDLDGSRLMVGDSTVEEDVLKLMGGEKVDMVFTDPPYRLSYLGSGKRKEGPTEGFGLKKNRKYLETDTLPEDFTEKWMANIAAVAQPNFSIICYENWKNLREIWDCVETHWKVRNVLIWHTPNRNQGFAGKNRFFSKYDLAVVGASDEHDGLNTEPEEELFENEYQTALFAIKGHGAHWESYGKDKQYCPTDHIDFNTADEQSSGQAIIFGVKPLPIILPYIKVLTKRGQLVVEPFGGSGSTLIAAITLGRRCYLMEKSPVYAEVILNRWEKFTGKTRQKIA